mgnify:CR=1 FL=1|tara:strand:+ start:566 stop:850 length:285 start_codon:yes stop_codon:yes gene_type:complete
MEEFENMKEAFNEFNNYLNEKITKHTPSQDGESDCCGRPVISDYMLCSECKEHCDYAPDLCQGCGDVEVDHEVDGLCCSDSCWKLYESETFYND